MKHIPFFLFCLWTVAGSASGKPLGGSMEGYHLLWQVGVFDDSDREFSLAPNHSGQYELPGIYVPGITEPSETWPYILPGSFDTWAGPGSRTFEIIFFLKENVREGNCRLILDFLDTHSFSPPRLEVRINSQRYEHQTEPGNNDWLMSAEGGSGKEHVAIFLVPAATLHKGENRVSITAVEGSWAIWDAVGFEVPAGVVAGHPEAGTVIRSVRQKQLLIRRNGMLMKPLELQVIHGGDAMHALLSAADRATMEVDLQQGVQMIEIWIPETGVQQEISLELSSGDRILARSGLVTDPVRKWEVHLIHQTHLDIGFTHTQEEVLKMQTGYLAQVLDLIDETKDYPEESRFRWHPEGMWAIDEFFRNASEKDSIRFIEALKEQSIHLDAFYVHLLSGLATDEELLELMHPAKSFERKYGVPVRTAIGSDVPGYSWGLVTAMQQQGIEFFNMAPNNNYKLGHLYHWADKPFYWLGPDGYSKVLTWMASHAYIYFWNQDEGLQRVPRFLNYLENSGFPYQIAMLRYEVGGDNGHPDPALPDMVRAWNEMYAYPRILLSTNTRLYESFTQRYRDSIPVYSGDLTPYWEDGAASTAADLALSRESGERLLQARALEAMVRPGILGERDIQATWNSIIMYDEHTWGAYCSKSDPYDPFTVSQERYKQQFAIEASRQANELARQVTGEVEKPGSGIIDIFNTTSWSRTELVLLSPEQSTGGDRVKDDRGRVLATQRLASGELAFVAENVPGFGSRRYCIERGSAGKMAGIEISREGISSDLISLKIDTATGSIKSIRTRDSEWELVDTSLHQLNEYIYVEGRETGKGMKRMAGPVLISVEEEGPLVGMLKIESGAPGCNLLTRRVRLVMGQPGIEIINTLDKQKNLDPEGVYFAFPMNVPGGTARIDIPWGVVRPETDQLPGANRNYFPVQRWVDFSNGSHGITWVTADAPMIKFAPMILVGRGRGDSEQMAEYSDRGVRPWWKQNIVPGQTLYSWVMNNHWEVNYKAFQEGQATFRYLLVPHQGNYCGTDSERTGRAYCQPLIAVESDPSLPSGALPFELTGEELVATSLVPLPEIDCFMVRLYNPGCGRGEVTIRGREGKMLNISYCDPAGNPTGQSENRIELPGYGVSTVRIETFR
jgi:alpha-mannosidase